MTSVITLYIHAHGQDQTAEHVQYTFQIPRTHITILSCGLSSGTCGHFAYATDKKESSMYENAIDKAIQIGNAEENSTMDVMENVQRTFQNRARYLLPSYAYKHKMHTNDLNHFEQAVEQNEMCKIYHPYFDRIYLFTKVSMFQYGPVNPASFKIKIMNVKNAPDKEHLVGCEITERTIQKSSDACTLSSHLSLFDQQYFSSNLFKKTNKDTSVRLSELIKLCVSLGFQYVNIYELSCRNTSDPLHSDMANIISKREELSDFRKTVGLGGARQPRRHRRTQHRRKPQMYRRRSQSNKRTFRRTRSFKHVTKKHVRRSRTRSKSS